VLAINEQLNAAPETVNQSPYGAGWLLRLADVSEPPELLTAEQYEKLTG